mmetsp:Transcript_49386/g.160055  ORF Transcript_49386/g.160055 Transcript_49386/m.160055 type:complete len:207 (-) Transcript_49386:82-702(-)
MATGQSTARQEAALHPCPATSPQAADALSCRRPPPAACRSRRCLRLQATGQRASIGGACGRRGRTSPQAATPRRASRCRHPPPLPGGLPAPASRRACSGAWTSARSRAASGCLSRWRVRAITTRTSRAAAVRSQAGGAGRTDIISKCGRPQSPGTGATRSSWAATIRPFRTGRTGRRDIRRSSLLCAGPAHRPQPRARRGGRTQKI